MASILKVDKIRVTGSDSDAISFDGSGNITIPKNVTFNGTGGGTRILLRDVNVSSSVSAVDFVNGVSGVVLDSTYMRYEITIDAFVPVTNGQHIRVRLSSNAGSSYFGDSTYNCITHRSYTNTSTTSTDVTYHNDYAAYNYHGLSNTANKGGGHGIITFHNLGGPRRTVIHGDFWAFGESYYIMTQSLGAIESNGDTIDALRIYATSGDIASGRFKLYGIK